MSSPADLTGLQLSRFWSSVLGELEVGLVSSVYETYLSKTRALSFNMGELTVECPSSFVCNQLEQQLHTVVFRAVANKAGFDVPRLNFVPAQYHTSNGRMARRSQGSLIGTLREEYTIEAFEQFPSNQLAFDAMTDVVAQEPHRPNPLVIHGPSGLGKTHLLQAACRAAVERGQRVAYLPAGTFTTRFTSGLREGSIDGFREAVQGCHLLAIDDYQQLSGRVKTQEELADTIEAMQNLGHSVVLAGEARPCEVGLIDRLVSRLMEGPQLAVEPLQASERRKLVLSFIRLSGQSLPQWAVDRLAGAAACGRRLRGAVESAVRIQRGNRLTPASLDEHLIASSLISFVRPVALTPVQVLDEVAHQFEVTRADLESRARDARCTEARAVASALLARRGLSQSAISALLHRDRATVRDMIPRGERLIEARPELAALGA